MQNKLAQVENQLSETHRNFLEEKTRSAKLEKDKREYEQQIYKEKEHR